MSFLFALFKFLTIALPCLICIPFFVLLERKVLSILGSRLGPWKVSFAGFLQSISDAGKLFNKEVNSLSNSSFLFYYGSSLFMICCSLFLFFFSPVNSFSVFFKCAIILILIILGLNSLHSIFSGWSTFSKFSLLGSLRTVCQLISYEVLLYLCIFFFLFIYYSFDLTDFHYSGFSFFFLFCPFIFMFWFLSVLAELNRTPYDFSEGESELVSGFNIEFGSSSFTLIFLAEYGSIFFFMVLTSFFFFSFSFFFSFFFFFLVIWIRGVVPRYRFDKLMNLSWKILLPQLSFFFLFFILICFY